MNGLIRAVSTVLSNCGLKGENQLWIIKERSYDP